MNRQGANKKTKKIFISCLIFLGMFIGFFALGPSNVDGWEVSRIDDEGGGTSIAIDSYDKVHISYRSGALKYATDASGSWLTYTIDSAGGNSSIGVDSNGYAHISYNGGSTLKYATN